MHVQLQYNGIPVPLPQWFVQGHNARNVAFDSYNELLDKLNKEQFLKAKGRPTYSIEIIHYGLHLRHTSFQAYKQ